MYTSLILKAAKSKSSLKSLFLWLKIGMSSSLKSAVSVIVIIIVFFYRFYAVSLK